MKSPDVIGYINAGGRGTRLNGLFKPNRDKGIAKALLAIGSPSVKLIDHHIANLRNQNIERVTVGVGDQSAVYEYLMDSYADDPAIKINKSDRLLGTGGDLVSYSRKAPDLMTPLLVQNVDTILDINLADFADKFDDHRRKLGILASIALTKSHGVPHEGAFAVRDDDRVLASEEFGGNDIAESAAISYRGSSTGAVIVEPEFLRDQAWQSDGKELSLYRDCLKVACDRKQLSAYDNGYRFFRDVGTIATWQLSVGDPVTQQYLCYNTPIKIA